MGAENGLILGDFHLRRVRRLIQSRDDMIDEYYWACSDWSSIKSFYKSYAKFKEERGVPDVVVLSGGNYELAKVSSYHCVITSLLRAAKAFRRDGVSLIVICSLVERKLCTGPYNDHVKKVNGALKSAANKSDWMYYFSLVNKKHRTSGFLFHPNGIHLLQIVYDSILVDLLKFLKGKDMDRLLSKAKHTTERVNRAPLPAISEEVNPSRIYMGQDFSSSFENEVKIIQREIQCLSLEKRKIKEYEEKIDKQMEKLSKYKSKLENIQSDPVSNLPSHQS